MFSAHIAVGLIAVTVVLTSNGPISAQANLPGPTIPSTSNDLPAPIVPDAVERRLKQMGAYLGSAEQLTFRADLTFDHVLPSGQKLQFSAVENIALQRPDNLYVEWAGDLGERKFWYDGKAITLLDAANAAYGSDAMAPTIDSMLDGLNKHLNFKPPLSDFLYSDPYSVLRASVQYGFATGEAQVSGRNCAGFAFVEKQIDWQIWIDTGPQLVPCKLVITYKNHPSMPQFSALFSEWDFSPRIAASTFTPTLPPRAQKIPFAKPKATVSSK
jgi:hypothetical protein